MKAHVISLKKDIQRREKISKLLNEFGYDFEIYDAVEPRTSAKFSQKLQINIDGTSLRPGEVGCSLSHADNLNGCENDYIFMLEDDVIPLKKNPFAKGFSLDLKDGEILFLGLTIKHEWLAYNLKTKRLGIDCVRLDRLSVPMLRGTCAYIVNRQTAKAMIEAQRQKLIVADAWKAFHKQGAITSFYYSEYFLHPQDFSGSNLEASRAQSFAKQTILRVIIKKGLYYSIRLIRLVLGNKYIDLPKEVSSD